VRLVFEFATMISLHLAHGRVNAAPVMTSMVLLSKGGDRLTVPLLFFAKARLGSIEEEQPHTNTSPRMDGNEDEPVCFLVAN
jgi:hypothetical protein